MNGNPYEGDSMWPMALLPFTKRGREALSDMIFGGVRSFVGPDTRAEVRSGIKCFNCECTTLIDGYCANCDVAVHSCLACECGFKQGLPRYRPFYYTCIQCSKSSVAN